MRASIYHDRPTVPPQPLTAQHLLFFLFLPIGLAAAVVASIPLAFGIVLGLISLLTLIRRIPQASVPAFLSIALLGLLPAIPDKPTAITFTFSLAIFAAALLTRHWVLPISALAFLAYAASSFYWGGTHPTEYFRAIVPLTFILTVPLWHRLTTRWLLYAVISAGTVLALRTLYTAATEAGRVTWHSLDFMMPPAVLGSIACVALLRYAHKRRTPQTTFTLAALFAAQFASILLTLSRTMILATLLGSSLVLLLTSRTPANTKIRFRSVAILAFLAILLISLAGLSTNQLAHRLTSTQLESAIDYRLLEFGSVQQLWAENPVLGTGMGELFLEDDPGLTRSYVHNAPAYMLSMLGLVGLALYLLFVGQVLWNARTQSSLERASSIAFVLTLLLLALTSATFRSVHFNMLLAISAALATSPSTTTMLQPKSPMGSHQPT